MDDMKTSRSGNIMQLSFLLLLFIGLETAVVLLEISDTTRLILLGVGMLAVGLWGRKSRAPRDSQRPMSESTLANNELGIELGEQNVEAMSVEGGEALPDNQRSPEPIGADGTNRLFPPSLAGLGPTAAGKVLPRGQSGVGA